MSAFNPFEGQSARGANGHHIPWGGQPVQLSTMFDTLPPSFSDEVVCFGMILEIPGKCSVARNLLKSWYPVRLENADSFTGCDSSAISGSIGPDSVHLTKALLDETTLELQVGCQVNDSYSQGPPKRAKAAAGAASLIPCSLSIILYGPLDLFDEIGEFLQHYEIYLQDPVGCDRNVRYCNPHRLPSDEMVPSLMTLELDKKQLPALEMEELGDTRPELLEMLNSQDELPETPQPAAISTLLEKHQKQALTFMHHREQGWAFDPRKPDMWEIAETGQGQFFINRISGAHQVDEPPEFYGGIIADPMGLGKTLTMIALIASDIEAVSSRPNNDGLGVHGEPSSGQTLVIVPPPLLDTWEEQLRQHVKTGQLSWCRHHAKTRIVEHDIEQSTTIVLTTYHTMSAEWRNNKIAESSTLFKRRWKRVILDEAHFIRNADSQMARAICALDAVSRWAVTGTPIQNRLSDLTTLLKFLQVHPYCDKRTFDSDITNLWKTDKAEEAVKRLKRLAGCILLRRPAGTIQLPARRDKKCPIEFNPEERQLYDGIKKQVISHIDEALIESDETGSGRSRTYITVLQQIEAMRMVCNLGMHYHFRHEDLKSGQRVQSEWNRTAQHVFNIEREVQQIRCHYCPSTLELIDSLLDSGGHQEQPQFSQCLRFVCVACVQNLGKKGAIGCGHTPPCVLAPVSTSVSLMEESLDPPPRVLEPSSNIQISTKVQALVTELTALPRDTKSVVFSTWRMTLDIVEFALNQANIKLLRFDGKVPQKERQVVIDKFRNDPSIKVLLLTLSCGAVGLTLTVASRAYLMEPHWNPTLEAQALARIHRMGQKKEVTTVRFYVKDSFEERVMVVQKSKERLAGLLLSESPEDSEESAGPLERLRSLL